MTNKRIRMGLYGMLVGGLTSGVATAILLALLALFSDSSSFFISERSLTLVAALVGLIGGGVVGGLLGALIGAVRPDWRSAIIIGNIVGLLLATGLFTGGDSVLLPASTGMAALGFIVWCKCWSLFLAAILEKRYPRNEPPNTA
jgi:MFS family permease